VTNKSLGQLTNWTSSPRAGPSPSTTEVFLLNQGVVLNERYIEKLVALVKAANKVLTVPVIKPRGWPILLPGTHRWRLRASAPPVARAQGMEADPPSTHLRELRYDGTNLGTNCAMCPTFDLVPRRWTRTWTTQRAVLFAYQGRRSVLPLHFELDELSSFGTSCRCSTHAAGGMRRLVELDNAVEALRMAAEVVQHGQAGGGAGCVVLLFNRCQGRVQVVLVFHPVGFPGIWSESRS
jgi:hypothetical protein